MFVVATKTPSEREYSITEASNVEFSVDVNGSNWLKFSVARQPRAYQNDIAIGSYVLVTESGRKIWEGEIRALNPTDDDNGLFIDVECIGFKQRIKDGGDWLN